MGYSRDFVKTIDSTNAFLKEKAAELPHFHFLRADYQSAGKGRESRSWTAEEAKNLLFSLLLKSRQTISLGGLLSLPVSVTLARSLETLYQLEGVSIKWPNDIYVNGRKVAGILLEGRLPDYIVIGMGINVNQVEFKGEYRIPPTSISLELGRPVDINQLERELEDALYRTIEEKALSMDECLSYYASHDFLLSKKAYASALGKYGIIKGVDRSFRLLVEIEGKIVALTSGEVDLHR